MTNEVFPSSGIDKSHHWGPFLEAVNIRGYKTTADIRECEMVSPLSWRKPSRDWVSKCGLEME